MLAGVSSGAGNYRNTGCIQELFNNRCTNVQPYKIGPDWYSYHSRAMKNSSRNLDTLIHGYLSEVVLHVGKIKNSDVAVVEGVMGLMMIRNR